MIKNSVDEIVSFLKEEIRRQKGLNIKDVVTKIGIPESTFHRQVKDKTVKLETILQIAEVIDIDIDIVVRTAFERRSNGISEHDFKEFSNAFEKLKLKYYNDLSDKKADNKKNE